MLTRITRGIRIMRPRSIAQLAEHANLLVRNLQKVAADVTALRAATEATGVEHGRSLGALHDGIARLAEEQARQLSALRREVTDLTSRVETLQLREAQLRALSRANTRTDAKLARLERSLDVDQIGAHARRAIAAAPLQVSPFPHAVVDELLPDSFYHVLVSAIPPAELFADRPPNKQQLLVPFELAPIFSHRVWSFMVSLGREVIAPAVAERFREPLVEWLGRNFPAVSTDEIARMPVNCSDGRILLRTRGYRIPPHRDTNRGLITCLLYLARPGDDDRWGTQLYSVDDDADAPNAKPHWICEKRCHLEKDVAFRPNRALVWLNSVGAHGASIPEDAPEGLQRYAYQFRIGPRAAVLDAWIGTLPLERQGRWLGKGDY